MTALIIILLLAVSGLCAYAAVNDFLKMEIPNKVVLAIVVLFVPAALIVGIKIGAVELFDWLVPHFASALIVFGATALLYTLGSFGAGDSKFATAVALWFPLGDLIGFLFYMALFGGLLGIATLILKRKNIIPAGKSKWLHEVYSGKSLVPYGIAIALGGVLAFLNLGYFSLDAAVFLEF